MTSTPILDGRAAAHDRGSTREGIDTFDNEGGGPMHHGGIHRRTELRRHAEHAARSAKEALGCVRDMTGDLYASARKSATSAAATLNDGVTRHPLASIGIAAGAGLLLGVILNRWRS